MKLPKSFAIGFSESGFQFEMGFPGLEDPNSDWWQWVHDGDNIASGLVSGDLPEQGPAYLALYREDHDMAVRLGADIIRIGVEWSRVMPKPTKSVSVDVERDDSGVISSVHVDEKSLRELRELSNKRALEKYREIAKDWTGRGKRLIINLNHFTLPIWIHNPLEVRKYGINATAKGWLDENTVVEFVKFVALIASELGEYVDSWSTLNEPNVVALMGYMNPHAGFPPGLVSSELAFTALRNQAVAHARAYDVLKEHTGKPVGVIVSFVWVEPLNPEKELDVISAKNLSEIYNYMFVDSVVNGTSLLVSSGSLKRRVDWIGVNYYTRIVVESRGTFGSWRQVGGYGYLCTPGGFSRANRPCSDFGWEAYPEGLGNVLSELYNRYRIPLLVTENGIADSWDKFRAYYIISHLASVQRALSKGVDIRGYLHWSLIDNYEWARGYQMKFGLAGVDLSTKKRYLRPSAIVFKEIAREKEIPEELLPQQFYS